MKHTPTFRRPLSLSATLLLAACASTSDSRIREDVNQKIDHGDYRAALVEAAAYLDDHPGDEAARSLHLRAHTAFLLDRGRELSFQDRDDEALEIFREVLKDSPASDQAEQWVKKTEDKLGKHWTNIGLELHAKDNLPGAMDAYTKALSYLPNDVSATAGLATARFLSDYRDGVGSGYYTNGVRALSEYYLQQARNAFEKVLKYREEDRQSTERHSHVKVLLSEQRAHLASELEADGLFAAASHEYQMAIKLDPENQVAVKGEARASNEARAKVLLSGAQMQVLRGNYDRAREMLAEGSQLTTAQTEQFEGASAGIETAIQEDMYVAALDLYRDGDYEGAVAAFDELLAVAGYYKDARTRRDNLAGDMVAASERYELARKAETDEERLRYLREIEVFWTDYKDIQLQIHRLEKNE